jgi:hypothetical protein
MRIRATGRRGRTEEQACLANFPRAPIMPSGDSRSTKVVDKPALTCLQNAFSTGSHQRTDCKEEAG